MTRARRRRTPGLLPWAACLLSALALLPARAGAGEADELRLPFLLADGALPAVPPLAPVLLPAWTSVARCVEGWDDDLESPRHDRRRETGRWESRPPTYPDVSALLRGASRVEDEAQLARLLDAVRAGFGRRVRVEVDVRMDSQERLVGLSGETPLGCLLVADARECRDYPAGLYLTPLSACAEMRCASVGPRLVASAVGNGKGYVLRLAVHVSTVVDETRFEAERLMLVAPVLTFSSLVAEVPAAPSESETIRCGDLTITYCVTPLPSTPPPAGTRVFSLDASAPLFDADALPEPGLLSREETVPTPTPTPQAVPPRDVPDAGDGIRRHDVPPGLVVLEGDEEALARADAAWSDRRAAVRITLVSDGGLQLDVALAPPARFALVAGRLDPVIGTSKSDIATSATESGPHLDELFTGRTLTITFDDGRRPRVTEIHAPATAVRPRVIPVVVREQGIVRREDLPGSAWAPTITRTSRLCRPDEVRAWGEKR